MLLTARPRKRLVAQLVTHVPKIVPIVETEPVRMKRAPELVLSSRKLRDLQLLSSLSSSVFIPVSAFAVPRLSPRVGEGRRR
jgi:hypothetical protein